MKTKVIWDVYAKRYLDQSGFEPIKEVQHKEKPWRYVGWMYEATPEFYNALDEFAIIRQRRKKGS